MSLFQHRVVRDVLSEDGLKARLIRGGLGSAGIQVANRALALALGIVLARTLGAEGYGIYAYAFAIMSLLMVAAEAGVPTLLMRELAACYGRQDWGLLRGALRRSMQFVGAVASSVSMIGLFVLWLIADGMESQLLYTMTLMLLMLPVAALCKTVAHAMYGLHRVVVGQAVDMLLRPLLVLLFVVVVFLIWPGLQKAQYAIAAQLLGASIILLVGLWVLRRFVPVEAFTVTVEYRNRGWLRSALPFSLIGGAGIINSQTDIIMLGWFAGSEEVGIYRVAVQGAMLVAFSLQVANAVVAPQFSRLYAQGDMARLQYLVTQSARIILLTALPVALVFILAGAVLVSWVFGTEFSAAYEPLAVLVVGQLALSAIGISGPLLSMVGFESIISKVMWVSALANIGLNFVLIPAFGMLGAAISTVVTIIGWHVYLYVLARNNLGIRVLPY